MATKGYAFGVPMEDVEAAMDLYGIVVDQRKLFKEAMDDAEKTARQYNPPLRTTPFIGKHSIEVWREAIDKATADGLIDTP